jgi:hypothetical protein
VAEHVASPPTHVGFVAAHVGFVAATRDVAAASILRRVVATQARLRVDSLDVLPVAARHFRSFRRHR